MFFLVVSCNKDIPNPIIGTWALVDYTAYSTESGRKLNPATGVESWTFRKSGSAYVKVREKLCICPRRVMFMSEFVSLYGLFSDSYATLLYYYIPIHSIIKRFDQDSFIFLC